MQDLTRFALASNLKWLLLAGLAVVALMLLYGSWLLARFGVWLPVLARLLAALALLALGRWLLGQPWGEDVSWSVGAWVPTEQFGTIAGAQADPVQGIHEPRGSRIMPLFWTGLFFLVLVIAVWQLPPVRPFYTPLVFVLLGGLFALAGFTALESWTRSLNFDEAGLCDTTLFGARRVPWSAIGQVKRRNINEDAQQSYDRARKRTGTRPQSVWVQELLDTEGRLILSFGDDLEPPERFGELLARAEEIARSGIDPTGTPAPAAMRDDARHAVEIGETEGDEEQDPALEAQFARMEAESAERNKAHDRTMRRGWLMAISPFILFTLWLGWKATYFCFVAERVQGTVVEVEGEELRSLTVEYRDAEGNAHRIGSDGTRANLGYSVGDPIRVFYHADAPDNARLDLFLELWLGTLISAGITALAAIPLLLMRS